jgi:hypothetical protein
VDLVLTLDTEADNQWAHGVPLSIRNVTFWSPFMELCARHGVRPTYLVTSEILEDSCACQRLAAWSGEGLAEVGAHLHPWTTPPFDDGPGLSRNDPAHAFPCDLSEEQLRAKLATLSGQITDRIGSQPTSFRAGRFGMNTTCAKTLADLGYVVDSSVTPLVSWRATPGLPGGGGGPDFRGHPVTPFLVAGSGDPGLVELPVTIMQMNTWAQADPWSRGLHSSWPVRLARRLSRRGRALPDPLWMRPYPGVRCRDLEALWHAADRQGLDAVVMMFHSSELMPGGSPYRPTRRSVTALLVLLDELFTFVRANGGSFPTLTGAAHTALAGVLPTLQL